MGLILFGVSYKTAPAAVRERMSLKGEAAVSFMSKMRDEAGISEAVVLSTCNRIEAYGYVEGKGSIDALTSTAALFEQEAGFEEGEINDFSYSLEGAAVARHLFTVVSSLDSMVLGEQQILGQVRSAYRQATSCGSTGVVLNRLFHQAMRLGKDVQSKTSLGRQHLSVAAVALDQAKELFGDLSDKAVLVVGAGEMAQLSLRYLIAEGVTRITLANRTLSHAQSLVEGIDCRAVGLSDLPEEILLADIVICSTAASEYVITPDMLDDISGGRAGRQLLLLDIAIPRDIDPRCADFGFVQVMDMDDLSKISEENRRLRMRATDDALCLIDESMVQFAEWIREGEIVPAVKSLRFFADEIVEGEYNKLAKCIRGTDEKQMESIRAAMEAVVNKLLDRPFRNTHEKAGTYEGMQMVHAMMSLFGLQPVESSICIDEIAPIGADCDACKKGK